MPWTDPTTHIWASAEILTAANMNTFIEANLAFLYGDTAWTGIAGVTLANSWVDFGGASPFGFRKIGTRVVMKGAIKSGTIGAVTALTMPVGYRPTQTLNFTVDSNAAFGRVTLTSAGVMQCNVGSNTYVALDQVQFDTI